jgi:hypothetical protein
MDIIGIGFYGWSAGIILFMLTWLALLTHRIGWWLVVISTATLAYIMYLFGFMSPEAYPVLFVEILVILLWIAHIVTYSVLDVTEEEMINTY